MSWSLATANPTEPRRSRRVPSSAIKYEPRIQQLSEDFARHRLKPFHTPLGVMLYEANRQKSARIRCSTCDGIPCLVNAGSHDHGENALRVGDHLLEWMEARRPAAEMLKPEETTRSEMLSRNVVAG